jgi:hypothetical protein
MRTLSSILILGLLTSVASSNTVRNYTGQECQPVGALEQNRMIINHLGCGNPDLSLVGITYPTCGTEASITLPISGNNSDTVDYDSIELRYVDNNNTKSISCTAYAVNSSGTVYQSSTQSSSVGNNGAGTFTWTSTQLPNSGSSISSVYLQSIICGVPNMVVIYDAPDNTCDDVASTSYIRRYTVDTVGS